MPNDCLLTYAAATVPSPVQTSTSQTPATARVNIAALTGKKTIYCKKVIIAVPVGTDASSLYQETPSRPTSAVNTTKWTISSLALKTGKELGMGDDDRTYARFTYECNNLDDYLISYPLVFGLQGVVDLTTGDVSIKIQETSSTDNNDYTAKTCSYTLTKSSPQFYLKNFIATAVGAPTVPASQFANGAPIVFSWESNGTFFQLYMKGEPKPVYSGSATTFTLLEGIKTDTTFILVASVAGGADSALGDFEPIYLYEALTTTVTNPDLTPETVSAKGNASVEGTLEVDKTSHLKSNVTIGTTAGTASLTIYGNLTSSNANIDSRVGIGIGQRIPKGRLEIALDDNDTTTDLLLVGKGTTNYLTIQHNGPVGIGTMVPKGRLHVKGQNSISPYTDNALIIEGDSGSTSPAASPRLFIIDTNSKDGKDKPFTVDTAPVWGVDNWNDHFRIFRKANLITNESELLRINNDGTVGIGTLDPKGLLHVKDHFRSGQMTGQVTMVIEGNSEMAFLPSLALINTNNGKPVNNAPAWVMSVDDEGNFGIGRRPNLGIWLQDQMKITEKGVYFNVPIILYNASIDPNNYFQLVSWKQNRNWACWQQVNPPSDIRLKKDVRPITDALDKVNRLQGALHRWSDAGLHYLTQDRVNAVSAGPDATEDQHERSAARSGRRPSPSCLAIIWA